MKNPEKIASSAREYLLTHKEELILFLKELVCHESPSDKINSQHQILAYLKNRFLAMGYFVIHVSGKNTGGYLYARPKNRNKHKPFQLLIGHCDTVWPLGTIEEMPLTYDSGKIKGPGIYDMKAGITQIVFSLMALRELNISPKVEPVVFINSDEETGSRETTNALKRLAKLADRAYVLEPPLGLNGKLKTARKGLGRFTITIRGKAAHAGLDPTKGVNAIVELSQQVQKLYAMNDLENGITVNVGMIEGGISPNMVAPSSKAVIDVRVLREADGDAITKKIKELQPIHKDVKMEIEGGIGRPPMEKTPRNQHLWKLAKEQRQE